MSDNIEFRESRGEIITFHADGRITVSEDCKPTETAEEVLRIMRDQWLADIQCAKIRELQERIKRLEEAGDEMWKWRDVISAQKWEKAKEAKP